MTSLRWFVVAVVACLLLSGCGLRFGWGNWGDSNSPPCEGNACADVSITPENPGNTINNNGRRTVIVSVRWMYIGCSDDYTDTKLGPGQSQTFENTGYCNPYKANYAEGGAPPPPHPSPVRVSSFTITPDTITAGETADLHVVLDNPAPAGGAVVGFSFITNTGLTDTIVNMPVSFNFDQGVKETTFHVRTQRVTPDPTSFVFTAYTLISRKSANFTVN